MVVLLVIGCVVMATESWALTRTGFIGEDFVVKVHDSVLGVWLPVIAFASVLIFVGALLSGRLHGKLSLVIGIIVLLAIIARGGLPVFNDLGVGSASGATLVREAHP
jgi:membrane protein required for beta-lactamase induction